MWIQSDNPEEIWRAAKIKDGYKDGDKEMVVLTDETLEVLFKLGQFVWFYTVCLDHNFRGWFCQSSQSEICRFYETRIFCLAQTI